MVAKKMSRKWCVVPTATVLMVMSTVLIPINVMMVTALVQKKIMLMVWEERNYDMGTKAEFW